jgi:hypothetical protein
VSYLVNETDQLVSVAQSFLRMLCQCKNVSSLRMYCFVKQTEDSDFHRVIDAFRTIECTGEISMLLRYTAFSGELYQFENINADIRQSYKALLTQLSA